MTATAVDQVGTARGERAVQGDIESVESAAASLYEQGSVPATGPVPRRIITVEIHDQHPTRAEPTQIRFEPIDGVEATRVAYRVEGGRTHERTLDIPIRHADGGPVELTDWDGKQRLVLRLIERSGERVVTVEPYT